MTLIPCAHCQRHVRDDENDCVFCGGAAPARARVPSPARLELRHVRWTAALALTTAVACKAPADTHGGSPQQPDRVARQSPVPPYGAAPVPEPPKPVKPDGGR